jgi:UDP-glucose 4-epimerase
MNHQKNKHFITGGAGFIGSHLLDRLLGEGNFVTVFDNLSSGKLKWIEPHLQDEHFRFIQADLLDLPNLTETMKEHDVIWHLGANTGIVAGNNITDLDLKNCTIATYNVLEAMRQNGISRIIFPSSATVYGSVKGIALSESYGPLLPISLYGAAKLGCEGLISAYSHLYGFQAWIFRFGNVMGSRMGHGVLYDFIHKLRDNPNELLILGNGNQEKNYLTVEDCLDGMYFVFSNATDQCNIFNLGCQSSIIVKDIANIVIEEMKLKNVKLKYTGGEQGWPGDVPCVIYDVNKLRNLGWEVKHSSADAIRIATKQLIEDNKKAY